MKYKFIFFKCAITMSVSILVFIPRELIDVMSI